MWTTYDFKSILKMEINYKNLLWTTIIYDIVKVNKKKITIMTMFRYILIIINTLNISNINNKYTILHKYHIKNILWHNKVYCPIIKRQQCKLKWLTKCIRCKIITRIYYYYVGTLTIWISPGNIIPKNFNQFGPIIYNCYLFIKSINYNTQLI